MESHCSWIDIPYKVVGFREASRGESELIVSLSRKWAAAGV